MQTFVWNNLNTVESNKPLPALQFRLQMRLKVRWKISLNLCNRMAIRRCLNSQEKFDKIKLDSLIVTPQQIAEATARIPEPLKKAIQNAKRNITAFTKHRNHRQWILETQPGVRCQGGDAPD